MTNKDKALVPIQRGLVATLDRQLALTEKLLATTRPAQGLLDVFYVPQDGTIEDAVYKVRPGGIIKIAKGEYFIEQGIFVDKPLRIEGEGIEETTISYRSLLNISSDLSDEDSEQNHLFSFITKGKIEIENICLDMNDESLNCLLMICADEVYINKCELIGNGLTDSDELLCGLLLYGDTSGVISNCIVKKFQDGIILVYNNSNPILVGNRCEENEESGICFASSSKATAIDNVCSRNKVSGISVQNEASPTLSDNICEENGEDGIVFMNSSKGTASGNVCRLNKLTGILVSNEAAPLLTSNRCEENGEDAIAYMDSSTGTSSDNICRLNKSDGIQVQNEASPTLIGNICNENGDCGIVFFNSSTGTVTNNICRLNKSVGILLLDEASPNLSDNHCEENEEDDIVFME